MYCKKCHNLNTVVYGGGSDKTTALGAIRIEDRKRRYGKETSQWLLSRWKRLLGEALSYVGARDLKRKKKRDSQ